MTESTHKRKRGRPPAKKSDPNYSRHTVILKKKSVKALKHYLIDAEMEMSELFQQLLDDFLATLEE
jgi:hypothetical protein